MNAPPITLDHLPSFCQKLSDLEKFDEFITKIILFVFFLRHDVSPNTD